MAEYAREALAALAAGDWYEAYLWTSRWGEEADGVWLPDTWLLLSACDVVNGHTRGTVHPINLGLRDWIDRPGDRAVLRWVRGQLIRTRMGDPATALDDLRGAQEQGPGWLGDLAAASVTSAQLAVSTGSDGEPMSHGVGAAPPFAPDPPARPPRRGVRRADGAKPRVFDDLLVYFQGRPLHAVP